MTKAVRIENGDTSNFKVLVRTMERGPEGGPDVQVNVRVLEFPTALETFWIHGGQRPGGRFLIVEEVDDSKGQTG